MQLEYLPIRKSKSRADSFIIELDDAEYIFEVWHNPVGDFFAFNLFDINDDPLILGRKITYNQSILSNIVDDRLPEVEIIASDLSGEAEKITYQNFVDNVKLWIFPAGDDNAIV